MSTISSIQLLGFCGSLRRASVNQAVLDTIGERLPPQVSLVQARIDDFPLYNQDIQDEGFPEAVQRVARQVEAAAGIIIVSPEYNYSIPAPLKNALDWLSRCKPQPFDRKPMAIAGATPGGLGTARMQLHLRQTLIYFNVDLISQPEVMISQAHSKIQEGRVTDQASLEQLQKMLDELLRRIKAK